MKILWLSHLVPYPPKGGVLQRSYNLVNELTKYHDVYLLAFVQKDLIITFYQDLESGLADAEKVLKKSCKEVRFIPIPCEKSRLGKYLLAFKSFFTRQSYTVNWLDSKEYANAIEELKSRHNFDFVHLDTISLAPYAKYFPGIKKSLDHHNIESHMMLRRAELETNHFRKLYYYLEGLKLKSYETDICPQFNINITCSELDSGRLLKYSSDIKVKDIPNGVDLDYFIPDPDQEKPGVLMFAGRLNAYTNSKAIYYFIDKVWPLLKEVNSEFRLNIVGPNPQASLIEKIRNEPNIRLHGFVEDIRPIFNSASIYVCPITDGGGTKLKVLDAMAMGKPIVGNKEAFEGINITDTKNCYIANTPEEYVNVIMDLYTDDLKRKQCSREAISLIKSEYSYDEIGRKLSNLFELC